MKKSLVALALGGLGIGVAEFTMMGMLPDVALDLGISIPEAGHLISAYAIGVVIGAPLFVTGMAKMSPNRTLMALMALFTIFNALSIIAPSYGSLMVSRFVSGLPHGAFFGVGAVVASQLADKGKEAQAVAFMFSGLTIANLLGVPIGTYIGHAFSWRYTFLLIALIGGLTVLVLHLWVPKMAARKLVESPWRDFRIFKEPNIWFMVLIISIAPGALFAWISYIAPLMTEVSGIAPNNMPYIMVLAGLGMVVGNLVGGKMSDKLGPSTTIILALVFQVICMLVIYFTAAHMGMSILMTFLTGAATFAIVPPLQVQLINSVQSDAKMLVASLGPSCFNIANALGAFLGGIPIELGYGYTSPVWVGAIMGIIGVIVSLLFIRRNRKMAMAEC
ncbi:MAG: MFS transporter [Muricauda sp.]|nr:MFS transporter [uncultured Allomuricauda sp.]MBC73590.1 MFS transporter [Allomuricauda sp.]|tara:strand:+ start:495 stop:1664 length:1170 start_codon:yes stop_codon:yes gene_type:complete